MDAKHIAMSVLIIALLVVWFVVTYRRARQVVSIDVHRLTPNEIAEIGTKSSETEFRKAYSPAQATAVPGLPGAVTWRARYGLILYTTYLVLPRPDGTGYRIGAAALQPNIAEMLSEMGAAHLVKAQEAPEHAGSQAGPSFGLRFEMWTRASRLLYHRWQTMGALKRADESKMTTVPQAPYPTQIPPQ